MAAVTKTTGRDMTAELAFLTRALKAPTLREAVPRLAERARSESWAHEEFPARKSLEEFDVDHARGLKREVIAHLGTLDFVAGKQNIVFLGSPGTGKTHLATGIAIRACQAGHRVLFAAAEWVDRLAEHHASGRLQDELRRLGRYPLLVGGRGRLHPVRTPGSEPVLPARQLPLRTRIADRHQQQGVRPLVRSLRRRHRRRRHDRPPRPPRRRHRPQRRQLPAQEPRPRPHPETGRRPSMTTSRRVCFQPPQRGPISTAVDTHDSSRSPVTTPATSGSAPFTFATPGGVIRLALGAVLAPAC